MMRGYRFLHSASLMLAVLAGGCGQRGVADVEVHVTRHDTLTLASIKLCDTGGNGCTDAIDLFPAGADNDADVGLFINDGSATVLMRIQVSGTFATCRQTLIPTNLGDSAIELALPALSANDQDLESLSNCGGCVQMACPGSSAAGVE